MIRIEGGIPAIISPELFERVRIKMNKNRHAPGARTAKTVYLLSGHVYCGECGYAMVGNRSARSNGVYFITHALAGVRNATAP